MKWMSALLLCFMSAFCLSSVYGANLVSIFDQEHEVFHWPLPHEGDVTLHQSGEYQIVAVYIPNDTSTLSVHKIEKKGTAESLYAPLVKKNTLVIASGGFFGFKLNGKEQPLGLVRSNGKRLVNLIPWDHGGVLVSDQNGHAKVIPASNRNQAGAWPDALQSKPIIINSGKVDVAKNLRDAEFNRVAIGFTREGDILLVGTFQTFGQAATLVDFAEVYKRIAEDRGLQIHRALAMDGGAGAQITLPTLKRRFGDTGRSYFPNAMRIDSKLGGIN
ncbi:UNVERIFIED_ORG: hypothetical protein J2Y94_002663 [Pseudomonas poae]